MTQGLPKGAVGLVGVLALLVLLRLIVGFDPFPWWSGDPTVMPAPVVAMTPVWSLWTDACMLVVSAALVMVLARQRRTVGMVTSVLFTVGLVAVAYHALVGRANGLDSLVVGSHWAASVAVGVACFAAGREPGLRGVLAGVVFGVVAVLAAKGVAQVYIEHPMTVKMFAEQRAAVFESQGWSAGSPMALAYERRLMQAEGTGWLGMSNVMATTAAAGVVAFAGMVLAAWKMRGKKALVVGVMVVGLVLAVVALAMTKSKGGAVACGSGLMVLVGSAVWRKWGGLKTGKAMLAVGPVIALSPLVMVVVRGMVGERSGELSVWFRWFYMQAAVRIAGGHPLMGVGPVGFKEAYLMAKNPLSPEEVALPHSVFMDWVSTLGVGGWAWAVFVLWLVSRIGRVLFVGVKEEVVEEGAADGEMGKVCFLVLAGATLVAAFIERPIASVDVMGVRVFGLLVGTAIAACVVRMARAPECGRGVVVAIGAGAMAAVLHAQIELTGTHMGAAPWWMAVVGVAAGAWIPTKLPPKPVWAVRVWGVVAMLAAVGAGVGAVRAGAWERELGRAAAVVEPIPDLAARIGALNAGGGEQDSWVDVGADLTVKLNKIVPPRPEAVNRAMGVWTVGVITEATQYLEAAARLEPSHMATMRALTRLQVQRATTVGDAVLADRALKAAQAFRDRYPSAQSAGWLGLLNRTVAEAMGQPERLEAAEAALMEATGYSPFELPYRVQLAEVQHALGRFEAARLTAREVLALEANTRLDPLKGLAPEVRSKLESWAE